MELLLKRGADPNFKDAEGKTAADVVGSDCTEDSREIVQSLLRDHAQKAKTNRQRRGSCPAIPRAAMMTAINASNESGLAAAAAPPSSSASSEKNQKLLPLPSVLVPHKSPTTTSPNENDEGGTSQSSRHNSFSAAAHIRVKMLSSRDPCCPSRSRRTIHFLYSYKLLTE